MRNLVKLGLCLACLSSTTAKLRADDVFRKEIREVLKEAEHASRKIKDETYRLILQRRIATVYGESGNRKQARELFIEFIGNDKTNLVEEVSLPNVETMLSRIVKSGNAIAARQLVIKLVKDKKERNSLISKIVSLACESNQIDEAIEITKSLPAKIQELKYRSIAIAFAKQGKFEKGYEFTERIKNRSTRNYSYYDLATQLVHEGNFRQASKIVENLPAKIHPDQTADLKTLVVAFLEKARFDCALKLTSKLSDPKDGNQSESFEEIATTLAKKKKYSEALKITRRIRDHWYRFEALANIASVQIDHGKLKIARQTIQFMNSNYQLIPAEQRYDSTVSTYVSLLAKIGNYALAMNRIANNEECDKPYLRSKVVEICASQEGMDRAIKLLQFIKDEETKRETKKWMISIEAERSGVSSVAHFIENINKPKLLHFYHGQFASIEAKKGNLTESWKHLDQMQDLVDKYEVCEEIVRFHLEKKDIDSARISLNKAMGVIVQAEVCEICFPGMFHTSRSMAHLGFITNYERLTQMAEWYIEVGDRNSAEKAFQFYWEKIRRHTVLNKGCNNYSDWSQWSDGSAFGYILRLESKNLGKQSALNRARHYKLPILRAFAFLGVAHGMLDQSEQLNRAKN